MNARNQQLARMLDQAMADLRAVSLSKDGDKDQYIQAIDLAIAKVDFVKVYLEDSTMPLPPDSPQLDPASPSADLPPPLPQDPLQIAASATPTVPAVPAAPTVSKASTPIPKQLKASPALPESPSSPQSILAGSEKPPTPVSSTTSKIQDVPTLNTTNEPVLGMLARPKPMPTRSTIAQS
jgi:TBC1 domain family protein 5